MATQNIVTQTGNRVSILLDGIAVGAMQSVRMSQDYGLDGVYEIGNINPIENVPGAARYSISCSNVVLKKGALKRAGIAEVNGVGVLRGRVFDIEVFDKDTGQLLQKYIGCSYASGDADVNRNAMIMSSAQFMALDVSGDGL